MSQQPAASTTQGAQAAPQHTSDIEFPALAECEVHFLAVVNDDGSVTHSILLPEEKRLAWNAARAFAEKLGGELPTRIEQAVLWARHRALFQQDWYWSSEQPAEFSSCAWIQSFLNGSQNGWPQDNKNVARAVRRVTIRQFSRSATRSSARSAA